MPRQPRAPFVTPEETLQESDFIVPSENTIHPSQREERGSMPINYQSLALHSREWEILSGGPTLRMNLIALDELAGLELKIQVELGEQDALIFQRCHPHEIRILKFEWPNVRIEYLSHTFGGRIVGHRPLSNNPLRGPTNWEQRNNTGSVMGVMTPQGIIVHADQVTPQEIRTTLQELAIQNDVIGDVLQYDDSRRTRVDYEITGLEPCSDISLSQTELNFIQQLELEYGEMKCACCAEHIHFPQNILKKLGQKETKAYLEFCKKNDQTPEIFCCKCYRIAESTPAFIQAYHHLFGQVKTFEKLVHDHVNQIATMKSQALEHERLNKEVELKKQMLEEMILELAAKHNLKNVNVDIK